MHLGHLSRLTRQGTAGMRMTPLGPGKRTCEGAVDCDRDNSMGILQTQDCRIEFKSGAVTKWGPRPSLAKLESPEWGPRCS
jgi:hypothetical protein